MTYATSYTLAGRNKFPSQSGAIVWANKGAIEGVKIWARDEKAGEYVRVLEIGPTEWVDNEPQAWSSGNFETVEAAKIAARKAYRYLNR